MTVRELKEALAAYSDDMEVAVLENESRTVAKGEVILDPYPDYNLLVITYQDEEE